MARARATGQADVKYGIPDQDLSVLINNWLNNLHCGGGRGNVSSLKLPVETIFENTKENTTSEIKTAGPEQELTTKHTMAQMSK